MKNILCVAVHPDDETLGCGGSLLKHKANGDKIYWLIITNISEEYGWKPEKVKERQNEIDTVAKMYSFDGVYKLDFPTMELDTIPLGDIIKKTSSIFNEVQPNTIYLPNRSDVHSDHRIAFDAVYSCTKSFRYPFIEKLLMMEVLSETEYAPALPESQFIPNHFIDISDFYSHKVEIMKIFKSELMENNQPRSLNIIEAVSKFRGSRISAKYAEAFNLIYCRE